MSLARDSWDTYITIGGGEPTLHPLFMDYLGLAMASSTDVVTIITNGSQTKTALWLASLARQGKISCDISQDPFHDPIDIEVIRAFTVKNRQSNDFRGIRNTSKSLVEIGRAKDNELYCSSKGCVCDDLFITPAGTIYQCGCKKKKLGTVFDKNLDLSYFEPGCSQYKEAA